MGERAVWQVLRRPPFDTLHFRRQVAFDDRYIADFASHRANLIVEVDGRSHDQTFIEDARRTAWLAAQGYRVVRIANRDAVDTFSLAHHLAYLVGIPAPQN